MHDHSPMGKIWLQTSTNGSCQINKNFQQKMYDLFHGFKFICAYIDDLLILTKRDWTDHLHKFELMLNKLKKERLEFNIEKSFFGQTKM